MDIEEQVPSLAICQSFFDKGIKLNTALVWVTWGIEPEPYVVTRKEYENNDDMIFVCDAPTEAEIKNAIMKIDYQQKVWLKFSKNESDYVRWALEYENEYAVHQIAAGEDQSSPNALAHILEEVIY